MKTLSILLAALILMPNVSFAAKAKVAKDVPLKVQYIKLDGAGGKDMLQIAAESKDHSTLATAAVAVDLEATLSGPGPYTLFAPTNAAFEKLPKGTVETLLKPENKEKLRSILEHHAAAPAYKLEVITDMTEMDMVDGPKLKISKKDGKLFADDVEVKAAIQAKNGIIYIIDTILLPK